MSNLLLKRKCKLWGLGILALCPIVTLMSEEPNLPVSGLKLEPVPSELEWVPGPHIGEHAAAGAASWTFELEQPLGQRGSLMFWFRLSHTFRSGPEAEDVNVPLVSIGDAFTAYWNPWRGQSVIKCEVNLPDAGRGLQRRDIELPGLPGPAWIHVAYRWDADLGIWQKFLNGTPLHQPSSSVNKADLQRLQEAVGKPWKMPPAHKGKLYPSPFAISGVRISDDWFDTRELAQEVGHLQAGMFDHLLGVRDEGSLDPEPLKGDLLYENDLATEESTANWVEEGKALIKEHRERWMYLSHKDLERPDGHLVIWCPKDFPERYVAQWDVQMLNDEGLCIVFFNAKGSEGQDLFDESLQERLAYFPRYTQGDIDCYHISYYTSGRATSNLRKNSGFYLVDNGPAGVPADSDAIHRVTLIRDGTRIQLLVDNRVIIDFDDHDGHYGDPLIGGKIGFRQMHPKHARYRNFGVWELKEQ